jgi:WbqC-like protein family
MRGELRVAIMQPYFLPYIGYWQLMHNVDVFVVYDDIQYTKKGWINRNRFLLNGQPKSFTLPLKKDSDFRDISERQLSNTFGTDKMKLMGRLEAAYRSAPHFQEGKSLLGDTLSSDEENLFWFIHQSIEKIHTRLRMSSRLVVSSTLGISRKLRGQDRVIATCKVLNATDYVNPIGGIELYDRSTFMAEGIRLHFQQTRPLIYRQYDQEFVPNLSIIDNIMFVGCQGIIDHLSQTNLLETQPA